MHLRRMEPQPEPPTPWHDYRYIQNNVAAPEDMPHAGAIYINGDWYWWRAPVTE